MASIIATPLLNNLVKELKKPASHYFGLYEVLGWFNYLPSHGSFHDSGNLHAQLQVMITGDPDCFHHLKNENKKCINKRQKVIKPFPVVNPNMEAFIPKL